MKNQTLQYWFQTRWFKIVLIVAAVVAVVLVVMFSEQIGGLFERYASKAGTTIELNETNIGLGYTDGGIDFINGRLELSPTAVPWGQGPSDQ